MISSTIRLPYSPELAALLKAEQGSFRHARTRYAVAVQGGKIVVEIDAEDATALRTVVSSVCRVAAVYEKAKDV
jgi:tRNA threonylcarbamoyladenosine modification (KEOPS) complex  Pcc1 subunit